MNIRLLLVRYTDSHFIGLFQFPYLAEMTLTKNNKKKYFYFPVLIPRKNPGPSFETNKFER